MTYVFFDWVIGRYVAEPTTTTITVNSETLFPSMYCRAHDRYELVSAAYDMVKRYYFGSTLRSAIFPITDVAIAAQVSSLDEFVERNFDYVRNIDAYLNSDKAFRNYVPGETENAVLECFNRAYAPFGGPVGVLRLIASMPDRIPRKMEVECALRSFEYALYVRRVGRTWRVTGRVRRGWRSDYHRAASCLLSFAAAAVAHSCREADVLVYECALALKKRTVQWGTNPDDDDVQRALSRWARDVLRMFDDIDEVLLR